MGFNIGPVRLTELYRKKYDAFTENLGLAIAEGKKITFADNDITNLLKLQHERIMDKGLSIDYEVTDKEEADELDLGPMVLSDWKDAHYQNYVCLEEYDVKRTVKQDGKKQYSDRRHNTLHTVITDVTSGIRADLEPCTCPNCGAVSTISRLVDGCPYCKTMYKMDDLFPRITRYYFTEDAAPKEREDTRLRGKVLLGGLILGFIIGTILNLYSINVYDDEYNLFEHFIVTIFGMLITYSAFCVLDVLNLIRRGIVNNAGKWGTAGTHGKFEHMMKAYSPEFSFDYFSGKALSLIKTAVYSKDEQDLLFYKGPALDKRFKDIIDMNYGNAMKLISFTENNGSVTVAMDVFFDTLYAFDNKIKYKHEKYRAVFRRRVDIPLNLQFSMTRISCPKCSGSFNAVLNKNCPFCGTEYDIESQDWVLLELSQYN
jgi:hypothetical protein